MTSLTLSVKSGSVESLKVSIRWGFSPNARQMRLIADWDIPVVVAIDRVDQWVAFVGVSWRVFTMTASTLSSVTVRGAPGRGSSTSPSRRLAMNLPRHLPTVTGFTPSRAATAWFVIPASAHPRTILDRNASDCALFGRRAHRSRVSLSSSERTRGFIGRPRVCMCTSMVTYENAPSNPEIPDQRIFLANR